MITLINQLDKNQIEMINFILNLLKDTYLNVNYKFKLYILKAFSKLAIR